MMLTELSCGNLSSLLTMCQQEKKYYPDDHGLLDATLPYPTKIYFTEKDNGHDNDDDFDINDIDKIPQSFDVSFCRLKMIQWCYQIMHYYNNSYDSTNRIYVEMTMSYMDRFLLTKMGQTILVNSDRYQLATVTALYMVMKIHSAHTTTSDHQNNTWKAYNPEMVAIFFTQNLYEPKEIVTMEQNILFALDWYLNPPTTDDIN